MYKAGTRLTHQAPHPWWQMCVVPATVSAEVLYVLNVQSWYTFVVHHYWCAVHNMQYPSTTQVLTAESIRMCITTRTYWWLVYTIWQHLKQLCQHFGQDICCWPMLQVCFSKCCMFICCLSAPPHFCLLPWKFFSVATPIDGPACLPDWHFDRLQYLVCAKQAVNLQDFTTKLQCWHSAYECLLLFLSLWDVFQLFETILSTVRGHGWYGRRV